MNRLEIEQTLIAVTAQRLVELACPFCAGGGCSPYCYTAGRGKRGSVFEILSGSALAAVLAESRGEGADYHYQTLKEAILKGITFGFIKEEEMQRWIVDEQKK